MTASEIARRARMRPICELVNERFAVGDQYIEPYGRYKAKLSLEFIQSLNDRRGGKLILVTAISPTPAGEGKTTTTIGLGDALNRMGQKTIICLREPSLGPCFGAKGGAAGGGYSQVVPMDEINLHFTGDFHAINLAHNLLASLVDNHIQHGNALGFDIRRIVWPRVMDLNDRSLRKITIGLGGPANGFPREDGFEICSRLGSHGYPMLSHLFQRPEKQAWEDHRRLHAKQPARSRQRTQSGWGHDGTPERVNET